MRDVRGAAPAAPLGRLSKTDLPAGLEEEEEDRLSPEAFVFSEPLEPLHLSLVK